MIATNFSSAMSALQIGQLSVTCKRNSTLPRRLTKNIAVRMRECATNDLESVEES